MGINNDNEYSDMELDKLQKNYETLSDNVLETVGQNIFNLVGKLLEMERELTLREYFPEA